MTLPLAGSESYANFADQLLSWEEREPLIEAYCTEVGLPAGEAGATAALRAQLEDPAAPGRHSRWVPAQHRPDGSTRAGRCSGGGAAGSAAPRR